MAGFILLEGGAEFSGYMAGPDRRAMALAGGPHVRISIIPAAAAPDDNHVRAGANGVQWFRSLGATHASNLPLIDYASANAAAITDILKHSRLIYLLGGFTHYLGQTLMGSTAWQAIVYAYQAGAVVAGSSAGAMVLCDHYYDPMTDRVVEGLGLLRHSCILPHYNSFGKNWVGRLRDLLPDITLVGIDEQTGIIDDGEIPVHRWCAYGRGAVTILRRGVVRVYRSGDRFALE